MSTLNELMKIHPPGTRFTTSLFGTGSYFTCWFRAGAMWHGVFSTPGHEDEKDTRPGQNDGWSIYQEPKKKVKKWLCAKRWDNDFVLVCHVEEISINGGNGAYCRYVPNFLSENEVPTGCNWIKLEHTMIEVIEDE